MEFDSSLITTWLDRIRADAPPLQARVSKPLRIIMIGWARLSLGAREGSGLNLSVSELAANLVERGHTVVYLRSGMDYSLKPGMRIEMSEVWRGVGCFTLINSPNLAPGNLNFRNPHAQISHAQQAKLVKDWAQAFAPDVIHIHALEGFPFDTIPALKASNARVYITPHNYYYLCPQVDLLNLESHVCEDFEGGTRCIDCLDHAPDPASHIAWRKRFQTAERLFGPHALTLLKDRIEHTKRGLHRLFEPNQVPTSPNGPPPRDRPRILPGSPHDQNERLLAASCKLRSLNIYGDRRTAGVAVLNASDGILCPSRFLLGVHQSFGVESRLLRHVPLGQPHFDGILQAAKSSHYYESSPWNPTSPRPLRFAYFGNCYPNKGLATLCKTIELLPKTIAARSHFVIRASGDDEPFRQWMQGRSNVSFLGSYDLRQLLSSAGGYDVCIFPNMGLENSPLVVLEALHAGKFVIASQLGGPTDWIQPPRNGLLFPAGDCDALVSAITSLIKGLVHVPSPKAIHEVSTLESFSSYTSHIETIYNSGLAQQGLTAQRRDFSPAAHVLTNPSQSPNLTPGTPPLPHHFRPNAPFGYHQHPQ